MAPPTCKICKERYEPGSRNPLLLPCGHNFCQGCLTTMCEKGNYKCPSCRRTNRWDVNKLPVVYDMLDPSLGNNSGSVESHVDEAEIEVVVKDVHEKNTVIKVRLDDKIVLLKKKLLKARPDLQVSQEHVVLLYKGKRLNNADATVWEVGLRDGHSINMKVPLPADKQRDVFQVVVMDISGRKCSLKLTPADTIEQVKQKLLQARPELLGQRGNISLIHEGKILNDYEATVLQVGLKEGNHIQMSVNYDGGKPRKIVSHAKLFAVGMKVAE